MSKSKKNQEVKEQLDVPAQAEAPVVNEEQQASSEVVDPLSPEERAQVQADAVKAHEESGVEVKNESGEVFAPVPPEALKISDEAQKVGSDKDQNDSSVVDLNAGEKFDLSKPITRDIATLSAARKQVMIDLIAARKDEDGHELVKQLESSLEQIDRELLPLKEDVLRKQEKLKASQAIGATRPVVLAPVKVVPPSTKLIADSQIRDLFKLKLKAPTSVAFDMVKICDIFEEAAHDLYYAYNANAPVIQEGIKALAMLCGEICEVIKEDEEKRLAAEAKK